MNTVGIFLFNDIELLDFAGPYEVFSTTTSQSEQKLFQVFTISDDGAPIKSVNGLTVIPDFAFTNHPPIDIFVIPGGIGTRAEITKHQVLEWAKNVSANAKITMTVCSGARIPAKLGLLDHLEATTHHTVFASLKELAPALIINPEKRFVDNGTIMTAGGISAGIDLSLHIVKKLHGETVANRTIKYMEYGDWRSL